MPNIGTIRVFFFGLIAVFPAFLFCLKYVVTGIWVFNHLHEFLVFVLVVSEERVV